ncbi:MAG: hypothetical protein Rpha_1693 [Candidatus Ruthia sp. Apha_13_S6]|nr:hypothetical protein [Candidatus Ruthia sp. Apha_13_S6]
MCLICEIFMVDFKQAMPNIIVLQSKTFDLWFIKLIIILNIFL